MDSFIFAVNAISPLIIMAVIGYILRRIGFIPEGMPKILNKLVFRVFLPCMLFLNVYKIESLGGFDFGFAIYAVLSVFLIFLAAIPVVMAINKSGARRGVMLQAVFRSNFALIGIPLASSLCGDVGARIAAVLSAFAIPTFNILAVITLSIFNGSEGEGKKLSIKRILLDIVKNPLIDSILVGFVALGIRALLTHFGIEWRLTEIPPLFKVLESLSAVATPLALITLGAQFKISAIGGMKREIIFSAIMRTVIVPTLALSVAYFFFNFEAAHFAAFVALFSTPVAVSSVPMTQEMGGDTELAGQIVVWTTAAAGITIFLFTFILRLIGIF